MGGKGECARGGGMEGWKGGLLRQIRLWGWLHSKFSEVQRYPGQRVGERGASGKRVCWKSASVFSASWAEAWGVQSPWKCSSEVRKVEGRRLGFPLLGKRKKNPAWDMKFDLG